MPNICQNCGTAFPDFDPLCPVCKFPSQQQGVNAAPAPVPVPQQSQQILLQQPTQIPQQQPLVGPTVVTKVSYVIYGLGLLLALGAGGYFLNNNLKDIKHEDALSSQPKPSNGSPTLEHFQQIKIGDSREKVIELLGLPNGNTQDPTGHLYDDKTRSQLDQAGVKIGTELLPYKINDQVVLIQITAGKVGDMHFDESLR